MGAVAAILLCHRGALYFFLFSLSEEQKKKKKKKTNEKDCRLNSESAWVVMDPREKDQELRTWNLRLLLVMVIC
jgi:hypothetical protein